MFALSYPATLKPETGGKGFVVRFPDLPEAITGADDVNDALAEATDCLGEALAGRIVRREVVPAPSRQHKGQYLIQVPLYLAPKVALYVAMRQKRLDISGLARRLGWRETLIRQLLDPRRDTKPEMLQDALRALGKRIVVAVDDAA